MPVKKIGGVWHEPYPQIFEDLKNEIILEKQPEGPPYEAPYIIEEQYPRGENRQVTVIWDRWADISKQERGRLILDAYREARGEEYMRTIRLALGLTKDEAEKLGISVVV